MSASHDRPTTPSNLLDGTDGDGAAGTSKTDERNATSTEVVPDFVDAHLSHYHFPDSELTRGMQDALTSIQDSSSTIEVHQYPHLTLFLTDMSKIIYDRLSEQQKNEARQHLHVPEGAESGHLVFIDHHTRSVSHSPAGQNVQDKPDLLAVVDPDSLKDFKGAYGRVPYHRVESLVEVKTAKAEDGRRQASSYAYRHQQARPDRPAFLCLTVKPNHYQIILSEPSGPLASDHIPWTNLDPLASYLYSIYVPPSTHFLYDPTIVWKTTPDYRSKDKNAITWSIKCAGEWYNNARLISDFGDVWGTRSTVALADDNDPEHPGAKVVIKEYYQHERRRFEEVDLLKKAHEDGDLPGLVRLKCAEEVKAGDRVITCGSAASGDSDGPSNVRRKKRMVLYDVGSSLLDAKSVNDVLKAFYDILEVHRTLVLQRKILHRDMSIYNMLMYPKWRALPGRNVMENPPLFVEDVLSGTLRDAAERKPAGLVIDLDHSADVGLVTSSGDPDKALMERTGTPKYIARAVSIGRVIKVKFAFQGDPMPELTGRALELYVKARGRQFYESYNDQKITLGKRTLYLTKHGGYPSREDAQWVDEEELPTFVHRAEYDVESIWWAMFSVLLRVQPKDGEREMHVPDQLYSSWLDFDSHYISHTLHTVERRNNILMLTSSDWKSMFKSYPNMLDVAVLLCRIAQHVQTEWAFWTWENDTYKADHLHEAMQRLIFQYLVDHADKDVELIVTSNLKHLRPVSKQPPSPAARAQNRKDRKSQGAGKARGSTISQEQSADAAPPPPGVSTKRNSMRASTPALRSVDERRTRSIGHDGDIAQAGPSTTTSTSVGGTTLGSHASTTSLSKRKSRGQDSVPSTSTSKRRKAAEEGDE